MNSQLDKFKEFIVTMNIPDCNNFVCLDNSDAYFNQYGLCGVVNENDKWVWCHQEFPAPGDRPNQYFHRQEFDTLEDLINFITNELTLKYKQTK